MESFYSSALKDEKTGITNTCLKKISKPCKETFLKLWKDCKRRRTLTCGTATDRQSTWTFCRHAELETEKSDELLTFCSDKCFMRVLRLTWCTSSAATLKLQVLDVDLEILLLSFFAPIL